MLGFDFFSVFVLVLVSVSLLVCVFWSWPLILTFDLYISLLCGTTFNGFKKFKTMKRISSNCFRSNTSNGVDDDKEDLIPFMAFSSLSWKYIQFDEGHSQ